MSEPERVWNPNQQAVFDAVAHGEGHLVVVARAGSGKTSTIVEAARHVPKGKRSLFSAFNVDIVKALEARLPKRCVVKTHHKLGYGTLIRAWKTPPLDVRPQPNVRAAEARIWGAVFRDVRGVTTQQRQDVAKLVRFAKAYLVESPEDLVALMDAQECGPSGDVYGVDHYVAWAQQALALSREPAPDITFDDMVYVPAYHGWHGAQYDVVFVDEVQDMNRAQLALVKNALRPGGRIVAVGDDRQAIYGFRGADAQAIPRLVAELGAQVLPLSITYRCPRAVVAVARQVVPDLEAAPDAEEGHVAHVLEGPMVAGWDVGDFVLSRTNAPLVGLCLRALQRGLRARIQGKDLGAGLAALVRKADCHDIKPFLAWLTGWRLEEVLRLTAAEKPEQVERVHDRAETLIALSENLVTVDGLLRRLETLFDDAGEALVFSSVHKAKGLETARVWLLEDTFRPHKSQEEANLFYVAVTRAREELYFVRCRRDGAPPRAADSTSLDEEVSDNGP